MSSSSHTTPTKAGLVKTFETPAGRRTHVQRLPPVQEGSNDSLDSSDGGAPLNTHGSTAPFAGLRSQSKSETNSPSSWSDRSSLINQASQLSEPAGLQSSLQSAMFNMGLKQLEAPSQQNTPQLNPSTAEFRPAGIRQPLSMYPQQSTMCATQGQSNMAMGATTFQPQAGDQLDGAALTTYTGPNTFAPFTGPNTSAQFTGGIPSQTANAVPQAYNTLPPQVGSAQLQPQTTFPKTNGMTVVNGSTPQFAQSAFNPANGVTYNGQNNGIHLQQQLMQQQQFLQQQQVLQRQQQQPYINPSGMTFVPQYAANNTSQALVLRDSNAPQQNAKPANMGLNAPYGNGPQPFNNMNGVDGRDSGAQYAQVAQGMSSIPAPPNSGVANDAGGMATVTDAFEQMSMSTLQAHLDHGGQYAQQQTNATATFPQGVARPAQYSTQPAPFQQQSNAVMQQQQVANIPSTGGGTTYGQSTPAPPSTMYNSPGGTITQARYMASPSYRGQSEPRNVDSRPYISNEPPPRFDLPATRPVSQQGHSNVMSPASAADTLPPRGTTASTGPSSSSNSVVDPFNGPALPGVILPFEPSSVEQIFHDGTLEHVRRLRSKQLNALTDTGANGRPRLDAALDAANFPFVESGRNAQPTHHCGVVKLKNVSLWIPCLSCLCTGASGLTADEALLDPLCYQEVRDPRLPWPQLQGVERQPGTRTHHYGARYDQDQ